MNISYKLQMYGISYKFSEEIMESFINEYLFQIKDVISHCTNKDSIEFTPSDFDAVELSQEDLDSLFD